MDCEIKLECGRARERRSRKMTSTAAIVNNENAMTNSAACWPVEATATGMGPGRAAGGLGWLTGAAGAGAGAIATMGGGAGRAGGAGGAADGAGVAALFVI